MEGGEWVSKEEAWAAVHILECLLSYHKRMFMNGFEGRCGNGAGCAADDMGNVYCAALEEAIRCIKIVRELEDGAP